MMRASILLSAFAAVALALPVVHQVTVGGPEVPTNRTCTPSTNKCAGAANRPFVPYAPCCTSGFVCGIPATAIPGAWGSFCLPQAAVSSVTPGPATTTAATTAAAGATTPAGGNTTASGNTTGTGNTSAPTTSGTNNGTSGTGGKAGNASGAETSPMPTTMPNTTTSKSDNGSKCFPSTATVELEDGSVITMDKLSIGDVVKVGANVFSKVFMFTHKTQTGKYEFVELTTATGASIALTSGHYMPVNGALLSAAEVTIGSKIELGSGVFDTVVSVGSVTGTGLYNPQTIEGNVVVNGIVASTYTSAVEPRFAHAVLAPFRSLSSLLGLDFTFLESGGGLLADVAPRGALAF